ncbi:MAG: hypothetical protein COY66_05650 [Candidatus Kerfeldbacteria bacterium CG_4_10_14_0_8_um_filter_42_10]|uniref:Uncharacterized protein n=1 Tax=Candidatus Kerfeldbacteria bacterium CG_4_10_14_0_8_um_filter_42_10 TaxID=2014248 RepID=A0A2M7RGP8_9BACT|nr:MAG: hypothetical protein COY66_05650 [Candidatus Kerfeldbacteria bacterium CG_4_10_14_0_8_um_filter_42_10]
MTLASTWKSPNYPYTDDLKIGNCTLINTIAEKDATHIYTLNPGFTVQLNSAYINYWNRNARCDELQFHVDHNTSLTTLNNWLGQIAVSWYKNISATHLNHQTISTSRHEWFYIDENGVHRIPDILTAWSFGLLLDDRFSVNPSLTDAFYNNVTIGTPLNFNNGQYKTQINNIWKNNASITDSGLPATLITNLNYLDAYHYIGHPFGYNGVFDNCQLDGWNLESRVYENLLDWSWMLRNHDCPLAS